MTINGSLNKRIDSERALYPEKRVLLVEGTGDIAFLTIMLDKPPFRDENLFADWLLIQAGGKDAVLRALEKNPGFHAMVDRDTWDDETLARMEGRYSTLHILPRFCIENYLVSPKELVVTFPALQKAYEQMEREVPLGIRHGCLWRAAQPLYQELMRAGFNQALLRYPPPDDETMANMILTWQKILSPEGIEDRIAEYSEEVHDLSEEEALRMFVHGKVFWRGCMENYVAPLFPDTRREDVKLEVMRHMPLPEDLLRFLSDIFL